MVFARRLQVLEINAHRDTPVLLASENAVMSLCIAMILVAFPASVDANLAMLKPGSSPNAVTTVGRMQNPLGALVRP